MPAPTGIRPQKNTWGGWASLTSYSGGGATSSPAASGPGDFLLQSGQGRLDHILQVVNLQSGLSVIFYDAGLATSGGPFAASGHRIVGVLPQVWGVPNGVTVASGQTNFVRAFDGSPIQVGIPFLSGLCVAIKSGQPGFTAVWTPEPAQTFQ